MLLEDEKSGQKVLWRSTVREFGFGSITCFAGNGQCLQLCGAVLLLAFLGMTEERIKAFATSTANLTRARRLT